MADGKRRIVYIQYTNPAAYPPLQHSSRILAKSGWDVLFLGTGSHGAGSLEFPPHPRITVRQLSYVAGGWRQKVHYLWYSLWCCYWVLRWRAGWVYASDVLSTPVALLVRTLFRPRVIYHEHDSPAGPAGSAFQRFGLWTRRLLSAGASAVVFPNSARAQRFLEENGGVGPTPEIVWNCPSGDDLGPRVAPGDERTHFRVLYHGSIVPDRLPLVVLEALAQVPDDASLTIVGYETAGSEGYLEQIRKRSAELGISNRVRIEGAVPMREAMMAICRSCDVGLALMPMGSTDPNLSAMTGASNKPFDYMSGGLALIVSDLPDWRRMFIEPGYAVGCDPADVKSIARALSELYRDRERVASMGARGRARIESEWNYEEQFRPVKTMLDSGLATLPGTRPAHEGVVQI
ncbi:MAG: glycosyltransferase [Bryobacteraceae bacterium]